MRYIQLGGFSTLQRRWDFQFQKGYFDRKITAQKVFNALNNASKNTKFDPEDEEQQDSIILTLGILPSGASVLLLAPSQVNKICSYHRIRHPDPQIEFLRSDDFESLSPIEFSDVEELAAKLSALAPKSGKGGLGRDTSQNNKVFTLHEKADVEEPEGMKRGQFEDLRVLRQVAVERIPPPPPHPSSSSSSSHSSNQPIHNPYARFSLRQTINTILPRISVVAFSYTLWSVQDKKDVLEFGWAKACNGLQDLRVQEYQAGPAEVEGGHHQVDLGWNANLTVRGLEKKAFPSTSTKEKKGPDVGIEIFERLLRLGFGGVQSESSADDQHLFLLVHNEPKLREILLDLGVDVLWGKFEDPLDENGDVQMDHQADAEGGRRSLRWNWIYDGDAGLKDLLRDDSYTEDGRHDRDRDRNSGYRDRRYSHGRSDGYSRASSYSSTSSSYRPQDSKSQLKSRSRSRSPTRNQPRYDSESRHGYRSPVKREPKTEPQDGFNGASIKHEPKIEQHDGFDRSYVKESRDDNRLQVKREGGFEGIKKAEADNEGVPGEIRTEASTSIASASPPVLQIHVLDLRTLFSKSTLYHLPPDKDNIQEMGRELQKGAGGEKLPGMLRASGEGGKGVLGEYSAGWDAQLMLSIFQTFTDGRTVDEQGAAGLERRKAQMEEDEEMRKQLKRQEDERREVQRIEARARLLDEDADPNDLPQPSRPTEMPKAALGEDLSDYGESSDDD